MQAPRLNKLVAPLAVVFLAAFLRLSRLATVPFGWHPDEATKALLARDVLAGKYLPPFFSAFTGREALFVYLEALLFSLQGEGIFSGRLLSAFVGILTVALTFATANALFNRRIGLLAAAFLAVSLWHIIASRNGYRAVIQPLVQLPVILGLFYGLGVGGSRRIHSAERVAIRSAKLALRKEDGSIKTWIYFLVAGIFLGLTQYTYTAVRFFPFLIIFIVLLVLLFARETFKRNFWNLVLMALVAFLIFLPLGTYFWQNPDVFLGRAARISIFSPEWSGGDTGGRLWQSVKETARMWTEWGDINYRFNISGQPVFGYLGGFLFFVGIPLSIWRGIRQQGLRRVAYWTLPLWLVIMLLPMILSAESLPYYQRAIGTLPVVYIFPAISLDAVIQGFNKITHEKFRPLAAAVLVILFLWLTWDVYQDYFTIWHEAPRNDDDRRVAMVYVADYLRDQGVDGKLYLSTQYVQHPTLALLSPEIYDGIHWFDARQSLPLPPAGGAATYLLLAENTPQPWLLSAAADLKLVTSEEDRFGRPVFAVYSWDSGEMPAPDPDLSAYWSWATTFPAGDPDGAKKAIDLPLPFTDVMTLLGYTRNSNALEPGDALEMILFWQLGPKPERQYTIFAHILNEEGQVVSGHDANEYPTSFWYEAGGEQLLSHIYLPVSQDLPPGEYQVEIGVYNQPSGERLAIQDGDETVADRLLLAPIIISE